MLLVTNMSTFNNYEKISQYQSASVLLCSISEAALDEVHDTCKSFTNLCCVLAFQQRIPVRAIKILGAHYSARADKKHSTRELQGKL